MTGLNSAQFAGSIRILLALLAQNFDARHRPIIHAGTERDGHLAACDLHARQRLDERVLGTDGTHDVDVAQAGRGDALDADAEDSLARRRPEKVGHVQLQVVDAIAQRDVEGQDMRQAGIDEPPVSGVQLRVGGVTDQSGVGVRGWGPGARWARCPG